MTLSIRYEVPRKDGLSSSVWCVESCKRDFVHSIRSRTWTACQRPSGTRNTASGTSAIWYVIARLEGTSSSIRYNESSMQDFEHPERSPANGGLVLVCPIRGNNQAGIRLMSMKTRKRRKLVCQVQGIKQARLHMSGTKSHETRACTRPCGSMNQAGWTSSV